MPLSIVHEHIPIFGVRLLKLQYKISGCRVGKEFGFYRYFFQIRQIGGQAPHGIDVAYHPSQGIVAYSCSQDGRRKAGTVKGISFALPEGILLQPQSRQNQSGGWRRRQVKTIPGKFSGFHQQHSKVQRASSARVVHAQGSPTYGGISFVFIGHDLAGRAIQSPQGYRNLKIDHIAVGPDVFAIGGKWKFIVVQRVVGIIVHLAKQSDRIAAEPGKTAQGETSSGKNGSLNRVAVIAVTFKLKIVGHPKWAKNITCRIGSSRVGEIKRNEQGVKH